MRVAFPWVFQRSKAQPKTQACRDLRWRLGAQEGNCQQAFADHDQEGE
jgi:hypothetical protein